MTQETPTGRRRHRSHKPFFGSPKLVLEMEFRVLRTYSIGGQIDSEYYTYWRDATVSDLTGATA